jgi:pantoate--beta-alanine ligase
MIIVKKVSILQQIIREHKEDGKSIGFTPTMGALHDGHHTLIQRSMDDCDITICSIFVNPTQFNEATDFDNYPRTLEADSEGLEKTGCDIVFAPSAREMYPDGIDYKNDVDLNGLDEVMEGAHRPGHFAGVIQVVKLLVDITDCDKLYMGQKDFQQFSIIRQMLRSLQYEAQLVVCPISRDPDGLARSSRNRRLTEEHRSDAPNIYNVLIETKQNINTIDIDTLQSSAIKDLTIPGFKPEYFDIIDGHTLRSISNAEDSNLVVACTAVWAGDVRLIDNMVLKGEL